MNALSEKANRLIWQNRSRNGGTKLLQRATEIEDSSKFVAQYFTGIGHTKALIDGSQGERYEAWIFASQKVYCSCAFFAELEPFQRQALGCKHVLALALRVLRQQKAA